MITVLIFGGKHKVQTTPKVAAKHKGKHPVELNPLVTFNYPSSKESWHHIPRTVRLIAANATYYIGLDVGDKNRFKKFLRRKASQFSVVNFNPEALQ